VNTALERQREIETLGEGIATFENRPHPRQLEMLDEQPVTSAKNW
jgi:hypothetical protein